MATATEPRRNVNLKLALEQWGNFLDLLRNQVLYVLTSDEVEDELTLRRLRVGIRKTYEILEIAMAWDYRRHFVHEEYRLIREIFDLLSNYNKANHELLNDLLSEVVSLKEQMRRLPRPEARQKPSSSFGPN